MVEAKDSGSFLKEMAPEYLLKNLGFSLLGFKWWLQQEFPPCETYRSAKHWHRTNTPYDVHQWKCHEGKIKQDERCRAFGYCFR